jgi:hypothetical protein
MSIDTLKPWIEVIASLSALIIGLVTALWAYTKFILERGLLPATDFTLECNVLGRQGDKTLLEIILHLKNIGSSVLIANDIRVDIRYLESAPRLSAKQKLLGRAEFPKSVLDELLKDVPEDEREGLKTGRGFSVMPYDSFVQSGVDQRYTFPTAVPASATYALVWSSFRYAQKPKAMQRAALAVSRRLGLVQFTLRHVTKPHTTERVFKLG